MTLLDQHVTAGPATARTAPAATWVPVCDRLELEPLWGEAALVGGVQLALFLLPDGRVFAVSNLDPATGAAVLSRGIVGSRAVDGVQRATIASPLYKDVFDLETGVCYTSPRLHLATWSVRETDGVIEVAQRTALVCASHGTSDDDGRTAVAALVQAVREANPAADVLDSFVDVQQPDVPASLGTLEPDRPAVVVPLLLSAGYHVHVDLAEAAAEAERPVRVTGALGPDPRLARVLARRLREAGLADGDRVVLAAAGSSDAGAVADCWATGRLLAAELGREVAVSFISAAEPRVPEAVAAERAAHPGARVLVSTYLLAPGYFASLAASAGADLATAPLLTAVDPPARELVDIVSELFGRSA
ncbi:MULTISPECIES: nitrite reductase small subunit NirD [unclassified Rathayibacter]|uniref:nitrite reductase small subunit NirD n=1 Tax=unclassified Rathayibacter TaxID=2609250 RepID=UPI000F4B5D86|nr:MULTISPECIES: nitrite reductase small subunit NirD [unclassified Rathayibacter]ROP45160.1 NAD(P)H-dependent nitrite reductase small subunit [Rathayibacter sp. PhB186]ROS47803.1 NAD(P)H-dependent nitrite reductase small subunit [Rathayibacter sp. PhB185]